MVFNEKSCVLHTICDTFWYPFTMFIFERIRCSFLIRKYMFSKKFLQLLYQQNRQKVRDFGEFLVGKWCEMKRRLRLEMLEKTPLFGSWKKWAHFDNNSRVFCGFMLLQNQHEFTNFTVFQPRISRRERALFTYFFANWFVLECL